MKHVSTFEKARMIEALRRFIRALIESDRFDYIVPVERKGTALIRSVLNEGESQQWRRIVSSEAVAAVLCKQTGARILVLDDSVWSGNRMRQTVDTLRGLGANLSVTVAALMSHETAPEDYLDIVYYRGLDDHSFEAYRDVLIDYLEQEGSLLLDTEHVEVRAQVACSFGEFFDVLAGWGTAVLFASKSNRVNCTVFQTVKTFEERLRPLVPQYAKFSDAVCKLRVISRPKEFRSFSLIPICYPTMLIGDNSQYRESRMKWARTITGRSRLFHCVGLCLAIELVVDAMEWMADSLGPEVEFDCGAGGVEHLRAVFPEVQVSEVFAELERYKRDRRPRSVRRGRVDDPGRGRLERLADEILFSCWDPAPQELGRLKRLTLAEVLSVGSLLGQTEARASAALDMLIDHAEMLPGVDFLPHAEGSLARRVFGLDNEVVARRVMRKALLEGRGVEVAV